MYPALASVDDDITDWNTTLVASCSKKHTRIFGTRTQAREQGPIAKTHPSLDKRLICPVDQTSSSQ